MCRTSGAGKTTLLDALAQRISIGVLTGDMFVNSQPVDVAFPRRTGYCQQQDVHLETTTVREALRFSAMLRQPESTPQEEKLTYVEEVIKMLGMEDFAEAIVGSPGEGMHHGLTFSLTNITQVSMLSRENCSRSASSLQQNQPC